MPVGHRLGLWAGLLLSGLCVADTVEVLPKPSSGDAQFNLGISSLNKGDLTSAQAAFHEVLKVQPNHIGSLLGEADVAMRAGRPLDAAKYLQQAVSAGPGQPSVHRAWGRYLTSQRRFDEAEKSFQKAVRLKPQDASSQVDLGDFYVLGLNV
jgi:Tfp pilus assembly protein PilF